MDLAVKVNSTQKAGSGGMATPVVVGAGRHPPTIAEPNQLNAHYLFQ